MTINAIDRPGPRPRPGLLDITPYKGGESGATADTVKLSSNENCLGASAAAQAAVIESAKTLALYPDGSAFALRNALSQRYDIDRDRIVCGAGSDELLQLLTRAYAGPGDKIIYSAHGFLVYKLAALQVGARPVAAPETALRADVDALLAAAGDDAAIVFLANPNNPTGTWLGRDELARLHAGLPQTTLLVIDAAYAEFLDHPDYGDVLDWVRETPNIVVTRTFSKIHGLAALRLGWAYAPHDVIDVLNRVRGPFNVSTTAIEAGVAALNDQDFVARSKAHNDRWLAYLKAEADKLGLLAADGAGNFVLLRFPDEDGRRASDADAHLRARGLIVRRMEPYGLGDCLRVSVGEEAANMRVVAALQELMGAA